MSALDRRTLANVRAELARATAPPLGLTEWAAKKGIYLWSMQRKVGDSISASKRTAAQSGAGIGKSFIAAVSVCWWIDTHPVSDVYVWTTAPGNDQVSGILWEEVRKLHARLKLPGTVGLDNKWRIGRTLVAQGRKPADKADKAEEDPDTGQGFHRRYLLVILDDAGGLAEWLWTTAENITTGRDCRIFATGNPDHAGSRFAQVCSNHPLWAHIKLSVLESPAFTGEPCPPDVLAKLTDREWVADRQSDWGVDDRRYVSKVLGEFPRDHPDQVIPAAALYACRLADPQPPSRLVPVELGVDVGGGRDWTVIRERRGVQAGRCWRYQTDQPEQAARYVLAAIRETGATAVKVDGIGIGWGLAGELRNKGAEGEHAAKVHAVMVSKAASEPDKYLNLRSELWWVVGREACQQQAWDLSVMGDAQDTVDQLLMPRWEPDPKGRIKIEPKDDIRARTGGRSPDDADALLLAFYVPRSGASDYWAALAAGKVRA